MTALLEVELPVHVESGPLCLILRRSFDFYD
jgi:hypothetical protein